MRNTGDIDSAGRAELHDSNMVNSSSTDSVPAFNDTHPVISPEQQPSRFTRHVNKAHSHTLTFIIKPVNPVNTRTFVVSSEQEKVLRILDLVC